MQIQLRSWRYLEIRESLAISCEAWFYSIAGNDWHIIAFFWSYGHNPQTCLLLV